MAKLHFYYSAMNAGKSTVLLQSAYNYKERGMSAIIFSPKVDDRYGEGVVASRIGLKQAAVAVDATFDLYKYALEQKNKDPKLSCVLIDEVHFLSKQQIRQLVSIVDELDLPVLAYGLRTDFRGEPFEGSLYLMAWADQLIELKTICHCGRKATMNIRIDQNGKQVTDGAQVQIGGNDMYVAACREHYYEGVSDDAQTKLSSKKLTSSTLEDA